MSEEEGSHSLKDYSLYILLFSLAFVFTAVGLAIVISVAQGEAVFTFSGEIDIGQYNAIIVGIAMVAVTLVGQQLGMRQQAKAVADTDAVWSKEK